MLHWTLYYEDTLVDVITDHELGMFIREISSGQNVRMDMIIDLKRMVAVIY